MAFVLLVQLLTFTALMLGGTMNIVLLWLIRHHTPAELKAYSKLLQQTCIIDFLALLAAFLLMPVVFMDTEVSTVLWLGPIGQLLPFSFGLTFHGIWQWFLNVSISQFMAQFLYRLFSIVWKWKMPFWLFIFLLLCNPSIATALNLLVNSPVDDPFRWRNPEIPEQLGFPNESFARRSFLTSLYQLNNQGVLIWHIFDLSVSWVCAIWISLFVRRNYHGPDEQHRRKINWQMNRNMLIQASLPLPSTFVPTGIVTMLRSINSGAFAATPVTGAKIGSLSLAWLYWNSVLNPLVTLLMIENYRHQLQHSIRALFGRTQQVAPISSAGPLFIHRGGAY